MARARDANFHLGCLVKAHEDCVAVQGAHVGRDRGGSGGGDGAARAEDVRRAVEETRRACQALHDDMTAHIHAGTTTAAPPPPAAAANVTAGASRAAASTATAAATTEVAARKANFFTECYNFTSSVERFKRALDWSAAKHAARRAVNHVEAARLRSAAAAETLSPAELVQATHVNPPPTLRPL